MAQFDNTDVYCPQGHELITMGESLLFQPCAYCPDCDKIYQLVAVEVKREFFVEHFSTDRFGEIKRAALRKQAKDKITDAQLVQLGLLDKLTPR